MTSNQIAAAQQREQEKHDRRMEYLEQVRLKEEKAQNRRNTVLQAAKNINDAAATLNNSIQGSYGNALKSDSNAIEAKKSQAQKQYWEEQVKLQGWSQQEIDRHNLRLESLQLRDIQHLEYQDRLAQIRDEWNRNQDIVSNNIKMAENTIKQTEANTRAYLAQIERAGLDVKMYQAQLSALNSKAERELMEARTKQERASIVSNYISSIGTLIRGLGALGL